MRWAVLGQDRKCLGSLWVREKSLKRFGNYGRRLAECELASRYGGEKARKARLS